MKNARSAAPKPKLPRSGSIRLHFNRAHRSASKPGPPVVFVTEDNKILKIDGASKGKITPLIGHKVVVNGKVDSGVLKIDTITSVKM